MAKKQETNLSVDSEVLVESKSEAKTSKPEQPRIPFDKYVDLHAEGMDVYVRSYVRERFRGILKTREDWVKKLSQYMEGNK
jgi:hypothetical protein